MSEEDKVNPEAKPKQVVWTPEEMVTFGKMVMEFLGTNLAGKYLDYKKNEAEARRHYFESVSTHNRRMIYVLLAFLVGAVAFMSFLTWFGKVSGDALLFLEGTITGYVIVSVQRLVFPSEEPRLPENSH